MEREWIIDADVTPPKTEQTQTLNNESRGGTHAALALAMLSEAARECVLAHLSLVHDTARSLRGRYGLDLSVEELASYGMLGLVEAARRYQPGRGVPFATFARVRIRGAILDGLAAFGPAASSRRRGYKTMRGSTLAASVPCDRELADQALSRRRLRRVLHEAVNQLSSRERRVLEQRYWQQVSLVEIGRDLGVSKSRASRIHARCLRKVRDAVAELMNVSDETLDAVLAQVA